MSGMQSRSKPRSPRPWKLLDRFIVDADNYPVCYFGEEGMGYPPEPDDLALLLEAVNTFEHDPDKKENV